MKKYCIKLNSIYVKGLIVIILVWLSDTSESKGQTIIFNWSSQFEAKVSNEILNQHSFLNLSGEDVRSFTGCALEKMKIKFPNGTRSTNEVFLNAKQDINEACAKELGFNGVFNWNNNAETALKASLIKALVSYGKPDKNTELAGGIIMELKHKFPKGFLIGKNRIQAFDSLINASFIQYSKKVKYDGFMGWNQDEERTLKASYMKLLEKDIDLSRRKGFSECVMIKLKKKYPDGISLFVSDKPYYTLLLSDMTKACAEEFNIYTPN